MIRLRNLSHAVLDGGVSCATAAATYIQVIGSVVQASALKGKKLRIQKVVFNVAEKGNGTSFTVDLKKNGTSALTGAVTVTCGTLAANYTAFDTAKEIAAAAPTGLSALPALSATDANLVLAPGDALELVVVTTGSFTTAPRVSCAIHLEAA